MWKKKKKKKKKKKMMMMMMMMMRKRTLNVTQVLMTLLHQHSLGTSLNVKGLLSVAQILTGMNLLRIPP